VVSDCRRARPAGRLIERDGVLYRPAQNCTPQYGKSTVIHRVDTLTLDDYAETQVAAFRADRVGARRTHTLNFAGDFAVVDLLRRRK
ncbi:MAG: formyl transferase, partial [Planctomycetota bacterium]|nr:formyl transferase [Planctomycetota bacterium]